MMPSRIKNTQREREKERGEASKHSWS